MAIHVLISKLCQEDAQRHQQNEYLERVKRCVEQTQNLALFDTFLPTRFLKKGLGKSYRLIAYRHSVGEDDLIIFLRVLPKGSQEYEHFLRRWENHADEIKRQFLRYTDEQLQEFHSRLTQQPKDSFPPPDVEDKAWLYDVLAENPATGYLLVLETEEWVKKMRAPEMVALLGLYHQILDQLISRRNTLKAATSSTDWQVHWGGDRNLGVAYLYRPEIQRLVLLEPLQRSDNVDDLLRVHRERLERIGENSDGYSRIAARCYPEVMIVDLNLWLAIQKDDVANLALSPEEAELLEAVQRAGARRELGYPLFINGRAGSGKSTMLQYLAARYIEFALRKATSRLPLFLTCSPDLLERARETVQGLLTTHHERLLEPLRRADLDSLLQRCFVVFHDFLYSLLPPDRLGRFQREKYVNYSTFRRLWSEQFVRHPEARRMSPDLAWHTIRSYIKGVRSGLDDEMDPGEFNSLPRRRRSISAETFEYVYSHVWGTWYGPLCEQQGYWDDQDLAACILETNAATSMDCPAIFCDEAQDFTPVELDVIYQLSLFGRRMLSPEELRRVPIVFAGDPLQTINPTGFRWDAVRAHFHERFHAVLDPRRRSHIDINYRELHFNYRSNPGIVKFCNLIQLARAVLLEARDIRPQEAWWVNRPVQTVWCDADSEATHRGILSRPELVKLVNCEDGQETQYVKRDPVLKDLLQTDGEAYQNVFGPMRSKGLEFPVVVLYRFGDSAPPEAVKALERGALPETEAQRLPVEYFFNRLYVAASRAKSQLIIVDSQAAFNGFWRFATNPDLVDKLKDRAGDQAWMNSALFDVFLVQGDIRHPGEGIDPREQAANYAEEGRRKRDPYLLRQASLSYCNAGERVEAERCLANALELEGNLREAGRKYKTIELYDEAFRCFWEGRIWSELCELASGQPRWISRLETMAADFMDHSRTFSPEFLRSFAKACQDDEWIRNSIRDSTWISVILELGDRLTKALTNKDLPWQDLNVAFEVLTGSGFPIRDEHRAAIAFGTENYELAVRLWDKSGARKENEYRLAKAHSEPFPRNLQWLGLLNNHGEVLRQWREHSGRIATVELDEDTVHAVTEAAVKEGLLEIAVEALQRKPNIRDVGRLLRAAVERGDSRSAVEAAVMATRMFVREGRWALVLQAAAANFSELEGAGVTDIRSSLGEDGTRTVFRTVIRELAVSNTFSDASVGRNTEDVRKFLYDSFLGKPVTQLEQYGLTPLEVGAAIERGGLHIDAIRFYEDVLRQSTSPSTRAHAAERLVKCHERYADFLRTERNDEVKAVERLQQAERIRKELNITNQSIPEYPTFPEDADRESASHRMQIPLRVVVSKPHARARIEHVDRFETVTVDGREKRLLGDTEFMKVKPAGNEIAAWKITNWDCVVRLFEDGGHLRVVVEAGETRICEELLN